jgi:RNA polymerase sigma factor (sigma-70 family)
MTESGRSSFHERDRRIHALTEVVRTEQASLERFAGRWFKRMGLTAQTADLEDALEESYARAIAHIKRHPDTNLRSPSAWFRTILSFVCREIARDKHRCPAAESDLWDGLQSENETMETLLRSSEDTSDAELHALVQEILGRLEDEPRWIVIRSLQGWTSKEIADNLRKTGRQISAAAVRQIRSRALRGIRKDLGLA